MKNYLLLALLILFTNFSNEAARAKESDVKITPDVLHKALLEASSLGLFETWKILSPGDAYARTATKIFSPTVTLEGCLIRAQWDTATGKEVRQEKFQEFGFKYQQKYILFLLLNDRLPNTLEIEHLYMDTADSMNLPRLILIDLLLNTLPENSGRKFLVDAMSSFIHFGGFSITKRWYDFTGIKADRISNDFEVLDIDPKTAKKIYLKTVRKSTKCWLKGADQPWSNDDSSAEDQELESAD